MNAQAKIVSLEALKTRLDEHRRAGKTIVLANGCFDVLHVGHVRYLQGAAREGDLLVVGVNSDASVRRLKGQGRPILPETMRAELVAAVAVVNYVVIFGEPSVEVLMRSLRPDVHAKGTDYTMETVPEGAIAAELGTRVAIVGDPKQHSTRDLIKHVRSRQT
jgi:rfaE bifunctional protein nucleotidyltransferase chain/domain